MPDRDVEITSHESQRPVLRPEMSQPSAQCSVVPNSQNVAQQNQIMRQLEYQVVEHPAADWELSQGKQMSEAQPPNPRMPNPALGSHAGQTEQRL